MFSEEVLLDVFKFLQGEDLLHHKTFSYRWKRVVEQNMDKLPLRIFEKTVYFAQNIQVHIRGGDLALEQNVDEFWNIYSGFHSLIVYSNRTNLNVLIGISEKSSEN